MKRNFLLSFFVIIIIFPLLNSCEKEKENKPPVCKINSPSNDDVFEKGDTVLISVEASDPDGLLQEVRFYINNIGIASVQSFPYNFFWNTIDEELGDYTIKAIAIDN